MIKILTATINAKPVTFPSGTNLLQITIVKVPRDVLDQVTGPETKLETGEYARTLNVGRGFELLFTCAEAPTGESEAASSAEASAASAETGAGKGKRKKADKAGDGDASLAGDAVTPAE